MYNATGALLDADIKRPEAFRMKCQRQITKIRGQKHIRNAEVTTLKERPQYNKTCNKTQNKCCENCTTVPALISILF